MVAMSFLQCPGDVVSVDLGWHNTAYAHVDNNLCLKDWGRLSLGSPSPYSPAKCYDQVFLQCGYNFLKTRED